MIIDTEIDYPDCYATPRDSFLPDTRRSSHAQAAGDWLDATEEETKENRKDTSSWKKILLLSFYSLKWQT